MSTMALLVTEVNGETFRTDACRVVAQAPRRALYTGYERSFLLADPSGRFFIQEQEEQVPGAAGAAVRQISASGARTVARRWMATASMWEAAFGEPMKEAVESHSLEARHLAAMETAILEKGYRISLYPEDGPEGKVRIRGVVTFQDGGDEVIWAEGDYRDSTAPLARALEFIAEKVKENMMADEEDARGARGE